MLFSLLSNSAVSYMMIPFDYSILLVSKNKLNSVSN